MNAHRRWRISIGSRNVQKIYSRRLSPNNIATATFDFSMATNIEGGAIQAVQVSTGLYAMSAGDATLKGTVTFADYNAYRQALGGMNSYHIADLNLDGNVSPDNFNLY